MFQTIPFNFSSVVEEILHMDESKLKAAIIHQSNQNLMGGCRQPRLLISSGTARPCLIRMKFQDNTRRYSIRFILLNLFRMIFQANSNWKIIRSGWIHSLSDDFPNQSQRKNHPFRVAHFLSDDFLRANQEKSHPIAA